MRQTLVALAPFAAASLLAWIVMPIGSSIEWTQYGVAAGLLVVAVTLSALSVSGRVPRAAVPAGLVYLAAAGLLRNAAGGMASGAGALAVIPVFQTALYSRRRRDLGWILTALGAFYVVPTVAIGGAAYPSTQYRTTLLVLSISGIIGWATQHLVARTRHQADAASARERRLEAVSAVVRGLHESTSIRESVCAAAQSVGEAELALLYEPAPDGTLACTAITGLDPGTLVAEPSRTVQAAFDGGRPIMVDHDAGSRVGNRELWGRAGRPDAILYEPLCRGDEVLGVLVVCWIGQPELRGSRTAIVSLVAHEAAAVIARADLVADLAGQARTDPLTGLPNRRAWDVALERAATRGESLTIAILDLDHFKQFNDAYGHPAGDRLLKAAAASWREQLRGDDLLARIGGEEFGLLLTGCGAAPALEVVARLRRAVPDHRTVSAGLAIRGGDETLESVLYRADDALYAAKAAGRDRAYLSPDADSPPACVQSPRRDVHAQTASASPAVAAPMTHTPVHPSDA